MNANFLNPLNLKQLIFLIVMLCALLGGTIGLFIPPPISIYVGGLCGAIVGYIFAPPICRKIRGQS